MQSRIQDDILEGQIHTGRKRICEVQWARKCSRARWELNSKVDVSLRAY